MDETERDDLIRLHLPLVRAIARQYTGRGEPLEDLNQAGAVGLVLAARRFDHDRGTRFVTYAHTLINGEIRRHLRDHGRLVRLPRPVWELAGACARADAALVLALGRTPSLDEMAAHLGVASDRIKEALGAMSPCCSLDEVPESVLAGPVDASAALSVRERQLLELLADGLTQRQAAAVLGMSQSGASRLLRQVSERSAA